MAAPLIRIGNDANDYDANREPLCHLISVSASSYFYTGTRGVAGGVTRGARPYVPGVGVRPRRVRLGAQQRSELAIPKQFAERICAGGGFRGAQRRPGSAGRGPPVERATRSSTQGMSILQSPQSRKL